MSGDAAAMKSAAAEIRCKPNSLHAHLQKLLIDGFFDEPVTSDAIVLRIQERFGKRVPSNRIQVYAVKFMEAGILHAVKTRKGAPNHWIIGSVSREAALGRIDKSTRLLAIEDELFSPRLTKALEADFNDELTELHAVFGRHGNCTAFLIRKILEKLIIIVFAKSGKSALLGDPAHPGGWVGLKQMIETAAREKISGVPFLLGKTASEIKGIKFLGDTAAHNPLVSVSMKTIVPQMPFVITAFEELAARL